MTSEQAVYRQSALERLRSTDELDELLEVTPAYEWLVLVGVGILIAGALAWGILGSVSLRIPATGHVERTSGGEGTQAVLLVPVARGAELRTGTRVWIDVPDGGAALEGSVLRVGSAGNGRPTSEGGAAPHGLRVDVQLQSRAHDDRAASHLREREGPLPAGTTVILGSMRPLALLVPWFGAAGED